MFKIVNIQSVSYVSQGPVGSIESHVRTCVILWSYPSSFHDFPQSFGNAQMWKVWGLEEEEDLPLFTNRHEFLCPPVQTHCGIVKYDINVLADAKRKVIRKTYYLVCRHPLNSGESFILVVTGSHTEDIESCNLLGRDGYVLHLPSTSALPIAFRTCMALVGIVKHNEPLACQIFKFMLLPDLVLIELRRGYFPWVFSYTLISCANADKKHLKVMSIASLPVAYSHATFALLAHRRYSSSEESIIDFQPWPARVFSPFIPSSLYNFTHAFTNTKLISVCASAFADERLQFAEELHGKAYEDNVSRLSEIPPSESRCYASVNSDTFCFPITKNIWESHIFFYINLLCSLTYYYVLFLLIVSRKSIKNVDFSNQVL